MRTLLIASVLLASVICHTSLAMVDTVTNVCVDKATCGACIAAAADCAWCTKAGFDLYGNPRCNRFESLESAGCNRSDIVSPENNVTIHRNESMRNAVGDTPAIQLQPQEIWMNLRPNKPYKLELKFKQAEHYPVDLYYLLDLSHSMNDDKQNLAKLGDLLATEMRSITHNFRLGFGSFVDKRTMPYVSIEPSKLQAPCTGCVPPYCFRNVMPLSVRTQEFATKVNETEISGNLDRPEAGFDAVMQAIVCSEEIGWRPSARKLLVYSSDAAFHIAGDGKLGGIVQANDGECHLHGGFYSESLNQDYPSIGQIASKVAETKINIIFAVTKDQREIYEKLSGYLEGSTSGVLDSSGSNVVDLIQDNYNKISSVVNMKAGGASDISVRFRSACLGEEMEEVSKCSGLTPGDSVTFEVEIEANECPANAADRQKELVIYAVGWNEQVVLKVNLTCECGCEKPGAEVPRASRCNWNGTYECGACTCDPGFYGRECECALSGNHQASSDYESSCRMTNTSEICEGRGNCMCGTCSCDAINFADTTRRFSGKFCECNDYSCQHHNGKLCGGNGQCVCGTCRCNREFNGTACECSTSTKSCLAEDGSICNGQGSCVCGRCECFTTSTYRGPTCEECDTCQGKCDENLECVECMAFNTGPISPDECESRCGFVETVDGIQEDKDSRKMCQYRDENDCLFMFSYEYYSDVVQVVEAKECPEPVNILFIILGVVFGIVGAGILLLIIWRIVASFQDKREMAKFEEERAKAQWDRVQNPIYKKPTSTFQNPMYTT